VRLQVVIAADPFGEWVTVKEYTPDIADSPEDAAIREEAQSEEHAVLVDCAATRCIYNNLKLGKCSTNIITVTKDGKCLDHDVFDEEDLIMLGFSREKNPELFPESEQK
jgi:hypothetical protein